jgi:hypothetical protein
MHLILYYQWCVISQVADMRNLAVEISIQDNQNLFVNSE